MEHQAADVVTRFANLTTPALIEELEKAAQFWGPTPEGELMTESAKRLRVGQPMPLDDADIAAAQNRPPSNLA